jgi:hypothetical protein
VLLRGNDGTGWFVSQKKIRFGDGLAAAMDAAMPPTASSTPAKPKQSDLFGAVTIEVETSSSGTRVARVQLEDAGAMELDYGIPETLADKVVIGSRVMVPLQNRRMNAVVLELAR